MNGNYYVLLSHFRLLGYSLKNKNWNYIPKLLPIDSNSQSKVELIKKLEKYSSYKLTLQKSEPYQNFSGWA